MIHVRDLMDYMRLRICIDLITTVNILVFFLSGCMSDQRLVCPHSLNHTTSCGSGAHNDELIFLLGKEKKKRIAIVFQSSMSIYHRDAFLLLFLIMKLLSICTMKRAWLGTSALCEGDETKMGP